MKQKTKKYLSILSIMVSVALLSSVFGNGCQGPDAYSPSNSLSGELGEGGKDDFDPIAGERTVSTVYANQILNNMVSCSGIGVESVATRQEWENRKGSLSEFGYATKVTAPMLMAVTAIAGEVCNDLIQLEKSLTPGERNIFPNFDFSAGANQVSSADITDSMLRMSLSCWQRNLDGEETAIITEELSLLADAGGNSSDDTYNVAIGLCTGILSSLSAIEM